MKTDRNHCLFYCLLGSCLIVLLAACGPNASSNSTTTASQPVSTSTPVPPQVSHAAKLTVQFGCKSGGKVGFSADKSHGLACVHTLPKAVLTISVTYCNGSVDQSSSLKGTFNADRTGYYEWHWMPQAPCQNGPAYWSGTARVTAQLDGQIATSESSFVAD